MSRILVTVGTDHHPFQRLVDWGDRYAARHPEHQVFIQYGSARPPAHALRSALLAPALVARALSSFELTDSPFFPQRDN